MTTLPDEDRLELPADWKQYTGPHRGDERSGAIASGSAVDTASDSAFNPDLARAALSKHDRRLRTTLALPANADYAEPGLAFLDGRPDPIGAGAVNALLRETGRAGFASFRPLFDLIAVEHGPAPAVAAAVEYMGLQADWQGRKALVIDRVGADHAWWHWYHMPEDFRTVRSLVAAAPEDEYRAIVGAVGERRGTPLGRIAASVLVPFERSWLDEACEEAVRPGRDDHFPEYLFEVVTTGEQLEVLWRHWRPYHLTTVHVASLIDRVGPGALPLLRDSVGPDADDGLARLAYRAAAILPSDEAMAFLAGAVDDARALMAVGEAAGRFPRRVLRAVASVQAGAKPGPRQRLAALVRSDPALTETALPTLEPSERESIGELLDSVRPVPDAPAAALPALLVDPPWKRKRTKAKPVVIDGLVPAPIDRIDWEPGQRQDWSDSDASFAYWNDMAADFGTERFDYTRFFAFASKDLVRLFLERWNGEGPYATEYELKVILARFELDAVAQVTALLKSNPTFRGVLDPIVSLDAARLAADWLHRLKSGRRSAVAWFERNRADAAALLIPDALGKAGKQRKAAEFALRYLAGAFGAETVTAAAERYGPEAAAAIRSLCAIDPLDPVGVKIPKTDTLGAPALLPQVLLKGRREALPPEAAAHLGTVLAVAATDRHYAGLDVVAEACDRESLARFSWALFEQWLAVGAPSAHSWAMTQLAHFGGDDAVRDLAPLIAAWPGESLHQRAVVGLEVLGGIGSEAALRAIHRISTKVKFKALKAKATEQITEIAAGLGLSTEQLADRIVPDLGLDETAALEIDYGPRRFTIRLDEQLRPHIVDDQGKERKSLPKAGVHDDEELAETGRKRFAQLKKDLRAVAAEQVKRLEQAMVQGRTWTAEEFDRYFVRHPLMRHLTRRLVWLAEAGGKPTAFRVDEDRSLSDVEDDVFALPEASVIRLAHPVALGESVGRWSEVFADYELLQPFDQLSRPIMAFTDDELRTGRLTRFEGRKVPTGPLLGLAGKGWTRGVAVSGGVEPGLHYELPGAGAVTVTLDPGIALGYYDEHPEQVLRTVRLATSVVYGGTGAAAIPAGDAIDPVAASELLTGLARAVGDR